MGKSTVRENAESKQVPGPFQAIAVHGQCDGLSVVAYIKEPLAESLLAAGIGMWNKITALKEVKCLPCQNCTEGFMIEVKSPKRWKCWHCRKTMANGEMAI